MNIKFIIRNLFGLLFFAMILPSNGIVGIPIKDLLFLSLIVFLILYFMKNKIILDKKILYFYLITVSLLIWLMIGTSNGYFDTAKQNLKNFISLYSVIFVTYICLKNNLIYIKFFKKLLYNMMYIKIIFKIVISLLLSFNILTIDIFNIIYNNILNVQPVTMYV